MGRISKCTRGIGDSKLPHNPGSLGRPCQRPQASGGRLGRKVRQSLSCDSGGSRAKISVSPSPRRCCVARSGSSKTNLLAHSPLRPRQQRFLPPSTSIERLLITYANTILTKYTATHHEMDSIEPEQTPFAAVSAQSTKFQRV